MGFPLDFLDQSLLIVPMVQTQLSLMHLLDAAKQAEIIDPKQNAGDADTRTRDDGGDLCRDAPDAVLRRVNVDERRDQSCDRVESYRPGTDTERENVSAHQYHAVNT